MTESTDSTPFPGPLVVIPARLRSARLPEKPLYKLGGRELVLRVLDGARESERAGRVIVAADDERVAALVEASGGEVMMTPDLPSGNDRAAYVAREIPSEFVINVQVDDPMIRGRVIDSMINALEADPGVNLALLVKKIEDPSEAVRESIIKAVFDENFLALYFSRSPIPFPRRAGTDCYKHIGPYAWRRESLLEFASWPRTRLESAESLEMLRLLEKGRSIKCLETDIDGIEIDTPDDVRAFEEYLKKG
ncbi:MAG: 3-deoxy-manno-octulosonate cytidylyltransferase [Synergistaceae bacterium]|nr:3-deoxy-manno-octulosonate cytidylyltransferase [Synergistaceae bacterium]